MRCTTIMADSDSEVEGMWEDEEEAMTEEDKEWLIQRLRAKVYELKEQLRLVATFGRGCMETGGAGPVAHVIFFNNPESMFSRHRVEELLQSLAHSMRNSQMQVEAVTHYHQPSAVLVNSCVRDYGDGDGEDGEEEGEEEEEVCVVGSVEYYNTFCLDWRGVPVREIGAGEGAKKVEWKASDDTAVLYAQVYREPFWVDIVQQREERRLRRMGIVCFNCGDDHHLKDCPEPKNFSRIYAKRLEYKASLGTPGADKRYHMTSAGDRFQKFVPGKISEKLRKALGLMNRTDYPAYIYRMRELDYPPGYRLLAMEDTLNIYEDSSDVEKQKQQALKKENVIIYPGFNSPGVVPVPSFKLGCGGPPIPVANGDAAAGNENREKLKEWLDFQPATAVGSSEKRQQLDDQRDRGDMDDLGSLSDYEFEEAEMMEDGEEVVGFGLRKLLKTVTKDTDRDQKATTFKPPPGPKKVFCLDFPPGMVHDLAECEKSPKRWNEIKKILEGKKIKGQTGKKTVKRLH